MPKENVLSDYEAFSCEAVGTVRGGRGMLREDLLRKGESFPRD